MLSDAADYKDHAGRAHIDLSDVRLAAEAMQRHTFIQPPSREVIMGIVDETNNIPLPVVPSNFGVLIPPEHQCLTSANYDVKYPHNDDGDKESSKDASKSNEAQKESSNMDIEE